MTTADHDPSAAQPSSYGQFMQLVRGRCSCRCYDAARGVSRDVLDQCIEAARLAPSACNRQPWRFVIADDPLVVAALRAEGKRVGIPHPWWANVPVFVAVCARAPTA